MNRGLIFTAVLTSLCFLGRCLPALSQESTYSSFKQQNSDKDVALTFDDGPHGTLTPRLLDVLKEKGAKATFFVMGVKAQMHPDILKRADAEGHEIANHAWDHPVLSKISREDVNDQLVRTSEAIQKAIGKSPSVMRPPYGNTNNRLNDFIHKNNNLNVIIWSLDTLDWRRPAPKDIKKVIMDRVKPGTIILCHDIHPGTIEAVPGIIDGLKSMGYSFSTISQLIAKTSGNPQFGSIAATATTSISSSTGVQAVAAVSVHNSPTSAIANETKLSSAVALSPAVLAAQQSTYSSFKQQNSDKDVALTFDDGPHGTLTPRLLDVLKEKGAKATFFVMGVKAQMHPDILKRADAEGHEIANHAWDHPVLSKISREDVNDQLVRTSEAIQKAIGKSPSVMRPPYGNTNNRLNDFIHKNNNLNVIIWSLDTLDWRRPAPKDIIKGTIDRIKPGTIILCHDIHPGTIEAMPGLIEGLHEKGYTFSTVSELILKTSTRDAAAGGGPSVRSLRGYAPH